MKRLFTCLAFLFYTTFGISQTIPVGLDTLLDRTLDSMRTVLNVKSLSAAIQRPDNAVWASATGISSLNPTVNVTPGHVYLIGSVTKTITSACILQLAEEQLLSLDDSLYEWLDTIPYINPNITIRQLLRHQSGIYDVLSNPAANNAMIQNQGFVWDAEDFINAFIQPQDFPAGTSWEYSNTNYFLLGMIIEKVTGNPYYTELRNRFFTPLALNTFAIPAYELMTSPVAHVWLDITGDNITDDAHFFYINYLALNSVAGAAGGYYATAADLTMWTRTYQRGDLLMPDLLEQARMTVPSPGLPGTTYGLGLMKKSFLGYTGYGHGGDLAYAASSWYFPDKDISITVMTNDSKNNSWTLAPVVSALLKTYCDWEMMATPTEELTATDESISVFPNPFDQQLTINMCLAAPVKTLKLVMTDVAGRTISQFESHNLPSGQVSIPMDCPQNLASGVYLISASLDEISTRTMRVVK